TELLVRECREANRYASPLRRASVTRPESHTQDATVTPIPLATIAIPAGNATSARATAQTSAYSSPAMVNVHPAILSPRRELGAGPNVFGMKLAHTANVSPINIWALRSAESAPRMCRDVAILSTAATASVATARMMPRMVGL